MFVHTYFVLSKSECLHISFQVLLYTDVYAFLLWRKVNPVRNTLVDLLEHVLTFLPAELSAMAAVNPTDLYVDPGHNEPDNAIYESKH